VFFVEKIVLLVTLYIRHLKRRFGIGVSASMLLYLLAKSENSQITAEPAQNGAVDEMAPYSPGNRAFRGNGACESHISGPLTATTVWALIGRKV
jgi:hypothetical protein